MFAPKRDWKVTVPCSESNPDAWFPEHGGDYEIPGEWRVNEDGRAITAKSICQTCPVRFECLEEALERREPHGIWGGLTVKERQKLLKQRAKNHVE